MRTTICYDISDDKKRYRVTRILLDRAIRVQKSVFETPELDHKSYLRLRSDLEGIINPTCDTLRYYRLCAACSQRIEYHGVGPGPLHPPEPFVIIT